ncbi:hypothetical protein Dda_6738 [Drechslerella dactyloides]|uniref:Uncharacterized protein n=1 Tax=Drechslerella dactyloides TaxID=74499 RepID=A0AAD6IU25_DREDA|nr:hypothetical protein Dda_6738 [Drechslerella dactyloides]
MHLMFHKSSERASRIGEEWLARGVVKLKGWGSELGTSGAFKQGTRAIARLQTAREGASGAAEPGRTPCRRDRSKHLRDYSSSVGDNTVELEG